MTFDRAAMNFRLIDAGWDRVMDEAARRWCGRALAVNLIPIIIIIYCNLFWLREYLCPRPALPR
jgi:hypothetical protein